MTVFAQFPDYEGNYDPSVCPPTRTTHDTQHTCDLHVRAECPAPSWWEDHCHAYVWFTQLADLVAVRRAADEQVKTAEGVIEAWAGLDGYSSDPNVPDLVSAALEEASGVLDRAPLDASRARQQMESPLGSLVAYYRPRANEVCSRRVGSGVSFEDLQAMSLAALFVVLTEYKLSFTVPAQAYLRRQLSRRVDDQIRTEGPYSRTDIKFHRQLDEVLDQHPHLSREQAARHLIGTPDRGGAMTSERVQELLCSRQITTPMHYDVLATGSESSGPVLQVADPFDTVAEAIRLEEAANAAKVVATLTDGMDPEDVELLLAYTLGVNAVTAWANARGLNPSRSAARAQSLLNTARTTAAELLNVSKVTLANRRFDRNEEKFLEAVNTGRISPVPAGSASRRKVAGHPPL
ncbi:MAG: hypothetical protein QG661_2439, partial [Actinomycetota bacterium]|nr:hypothetical protein [Actinomycetota bacterium]